MTSLAEIRQRIEEEDEESDITQEEHNLIVKVTGMNPTAQIQKTCQILSVARQLVKIEKKKLLSEIEGEIKIFFLNLEKNRLLKYNDGKHSDLRVELSDYTVLKQKLLGVDTNLQSTKREDKQ